MQEGSSIQNELELTLLSYFEFERIQINDFYLFDKNNDSSLFSRFVKDSTVLCLYLPINSCLECVNKQLLELSKSEHQKTTERTIIISVTPNYRAIYTLLRKYKLKIPVFNCWNENIISANRKYPGPFFFLLNNHLTPWMFYLPPGNSANLTPKYLNSVRQRFNENSHESYLP